MGKIKTINKTFSQLTREGLEATRKKLLAEEKKKNGYLVVAGKNGKVEKVPVSQFK
jgi:diphthamide biosynthesis methyltransferase